MDNADILLIKQKQDHTDEMVKTLLQQTIIVGEKLTELTMSLNELITESRTANKRTDNIEKTLDSHYNKVEIDFKVLNERVVILENFKITRDTLLHQKQLNKQWWSENWYKILTLCGLLIPTIIFIEKMVRPTING